MICALLPPTAGSPKTMDTVTTPRIRESPTILLNGNELLHVADT
ncbi:hypothetical protein PJL18_00500 [Paenarthrobacter nicotinovorans]|nr:hypothetical protein [Paenarthrobacter nicotinovorans]